MKGSHTDYTITIEEGELILNNSQKSKRTVYLMFLLRFTGFLTLFLSFCLTMYFTYVIFRECITDATLANCIPLGSIFATFGSAVISVLSLYCGKQSSMFRENLSALHEQIPEMSSWKRWPFQKRYGRERTGLRNFNYYTLKNPRITFRSGALRLTMALPTCTADFYDLPILLGTIKMAAFYKHVSYAAFQTHNAGQQKDLFIFHCTWMIYRHIIRYKAGTFLMLAGSEFVLASILFSFYYENIQKIVLEFIPHFFS